MGDVNNHSLCNSAVNGIACHICYLHDHKMVIIKSQKNTFNGWQTVVKFVCIFMHHSRYCYSTS